MIDDTTASEKSLEQRCKRLEMMVAFIAAIASGRVDLSELLEARGCFFRCEMAPSEGTAGSEETG